MILDGLKKSQVEDDRLWEMIRRANKLTEGSFASYDDNAATLVPLMDRIVIRARETENWLIYYYAMSKFLWLVQRTAINDIRRAFQLSEMFHRDRPRSLEKNISRFGREWQVHIAAAILSFYLDYPQADDEKIERMFGIFLEDERRYGSSWNYGDYQIVMQVALMNRDKKLAQAAKKKLLKVDFSLWCYVCYYGKPMIGYCVMEEDFEGVKEIISSLSERAVPAKYRWCFEQCESAKEEELVDGALRDCLRYGSPAIFAQVFDQWKDFYRQPKEGEAEATYDVLFRALAGEWSQQESSLRLAEKDDCDKLRKRAAPLDSLHWALCWHCYFQMLDRNGVRMVRIRLGDEAGKGMGTDGREGDVQEVQDVQNVQEVPEWMCLDVAEYFEHQADELGAQMDRAREKFDYARVKRTYEMCFCGQGGGWQE